MVDIMDPERKRFAEELLIAQGVRNLTPCEQHEVQCLMEDKEEEYDREIAFAGNPLLEIRERKSNNVSDSASSLGNVNLASKKTRSRTKLLHVVQRLPEGTDIPGAHYWGQKILNIAGVGLLAKYYLEQDGETNENAGWRIHLHFIIQTELYRSALAQRIVALKITLPNMTQVYSHDSLPRLTRYLSGSKSGDKGGKVAVDKLWRQANGLKECYTRSDAADLGLDHQV